MIKKVFVTAAVAGSLLAPVSIATATTAQASESPTCVKMDNYFHSKLWGPYQSAVQKSNSASASAKKAYANYKYYAGQAAQGNSVKLNKQRANQWKSAYNKYNATARSYASKARSLKAKSNSYMKLLSKKGCNPFIYGE